MSPRRPTHLKVVGEGRVRTSPSPAPWQRAGGRASFTRRRDARRCRIRFGYIQETPAAPNGLVLVGQSPNPQGRKRSPTGARNFRPAGAGCCLRRGRRPAAIANLGAARRRSPCPRPVHRRPKWAWLATGESWSMPVPSGLRRSSIPNGPLCGATQPWRWRRRGRAAGHPSIFGSRPTDCRRTRRRAIRRGPCEWRRNILGHLRGRLGPWTMDLVAAAPLAPRMLTLFILEIHAAPGRADAAMGRRAPQRKCPRLPPGNRSSAMSARFLFLVPVESGVSWAAPILDRNPEQAVLGAEPAAELRAGGLTCAATLAFGPGREPGRGPPRCLSQDSIHAGACLAAARVALLPFASRMRPRPPKPRQPPAPPFSSLGL